MTFGSFCAQNKSSSDSYLSDYACVIICEKKQKHVHRDSRLPFNAQV